MDEARQANQLKSGAGTVPQGVFGRVGGCNWQRLGVIKQRRNTDLLADLVDLKEVEVKRTCLGEAAADELLARLGDRRADRAAETDIWMASIDEEGPVGGVVWERGGYTTPWAGVGAFAVAGCFIRFWGS